MKFKFDWFMWGMVGAVALAAAFPEPGAKGGWLHPEILNKGGVALIFFLHGAALPLASLKSGLLNYRLHLLVQACTFLFFPLLGWVLVTTTRSWVTPDLALGWFYLCALPSTVSSSVAMTAAAKGNVPGAVFNATLSSLLGVVATPLWVGWVASAQAVELPVGAVMWDLVRWLVLPLALGQLARPWVGGWIGRHKPLVHVVDRGTILLLVYTSFCDSMKWGVWTGHGWTSVALTLGVSLVLFWGVLALVGLVARAWGFNREDEITAVFCGSKKTLASGVPMAQLMFGSHPGISLILLPIMLYHPLQLLICGWLAGRWAQRKM